MARARLGPGEAKEDDLLSPGRRGEHAVRMRKPGRAFQVLAAVGLVSLLTPSGCGKDDANHPLTPTVGTPSTQLTGTFLSGSEAGHLSLSISIASASLAPPLRAPALAAALPETVVTAFGVLSPDGGGVVTLTGTYDTTTDSLQLTGQNYTFLGKYFPSAVPPVTRGQYTGPMGPGSFSCVLGSTSEIKVFCGEFQSSGSPTAGRWNIVIAGSSLVGLEAPNGDTGTVGFTGTVTGTGINRTLAFGGSGLTGNGTWNTATDHVAGTWTTSGDNGTWSGDPCLPGGTGPD